MKPFARYFSITGAYCLSIATAAPAIAWSANACEGPKPGAPKSAAALPADMLAMARAGGAFPSYCAIPAVPTDAPTAQAYKTEVVDIRLDGRLLARQTAATTFTLSDTDALAARLRAAATAPPPMTTPDEGDTEAFVKAMRAKAAAPAKRGQ
jgi:hypothetical protein